MNIRRLATLCGTSRTTVSLALRGSGLVRTELKRRIHDLARTHGYRANPHFAAQMSAIASRRKETQRDVIALVYAAGTHDEMLRPLIESIESVLRRHWFTLTATPVSEANQEKIWRALWARGVVGSLVAPGALTKGNANRLPMVMIGETSGHHVHDTVEHDIDHALIAAMEKLRHAGCRRIAWVIGAESRCLFQLPRIAFGEDPDVELMLVQVARNIHPRCIETLRSVDAVIGISASLSCIPPWVLRTVVNLSLERAVGNRVGVCPDISTLGRIAAELLVQRVRETALGIEQPSGTRRVLVPGIWHGSIAKRADLQITAPRSAPSAQ